MAHKTAQDKIIEVLFDTLDSVMDFFDRIIGGKTK